MLFDSRYEELIGLLEQIDDNFSSDYRDFVKSLPFIVAHKCRKMNTFEMEKGNKLYTLDGVYDEEAELTVEEDGEVLVAFNIYRIKKEKLDRMPIKESRGIPTSLDDRSVLELCMFEIVRENGDKVGYSFVINKRRTGYYIIKNVVSNNKSLTYKSVIKVDESELVEGQFRR